MNMQHDREDTISKVLDKWIEVSNSPKDIEAKFRRFAGFGDSEDETDGGWKDHVIYGAQLLFGKEKGESFASKEEFERCFNAVTDVCWEARELHVGFHREERARPASYRDYNLTPVGQCVRILIELQLCRFDFDYEGIRRVLHFADDAPIRFEFSDRNIDLNLVYSTFATLASGERISEKAVLNSVSNTVIDQSPEEIIADLSTVPLKIKHLLLHGMWLFPKNYYGWEMLLFATSILSGSPKEGTAYYRLGEAYRRLANSHDSYLTSGEPFEDPRTGRRLFTADDFYAESIECLDTAMRCIDPIDTYNHSEYKNYRVLVSSERQVNEAIRNSLGREVESVKKQIGLMAQDLENQSKEWLFRVVEILSIFVAIIGILIANITLVNGEQLGAKERLWLIVAMSAVFVVFFIVIHLSLRARTWVRGRKQKISLRGDNTKRIADMIETRVAPVAEGIAALEKRLKILEEDDPKDVSDPDTLQHKH